MLTSPARLCRPCRLAGPAHPAATAGFSIPQGEIPPETDCLLEGDGFEPLVPQREGTGLFETTSIDLRSLHLHGKQFTSSEGPDRCPCDLGMPRGCGEDRRLPPSSWLKKTRSDAAQRVFITVA